MIQEYLPDDIEEIITQFKCPKDFKCYKSGLEVLCKARDVGLATFLECLEEHPQECLFSMPLAGVFYCNCPLRVYIAKELKR